MDQRYQPIANFLTNTPWRKKEIVALAAEKSNKSERTINNWLKYMEQEGFVKSVRISRNRVFIENNKENKLPLDFEIECESEVQSLLKQIHQVIESIIQNTFPSHSKDDIMSGSTLFTKIRNIANIFQDYTINPIELEKVKDNTEELSEFCRSKFIVVYKEPYVDYIFDILDYIIILLENYDNLKRTEDDSNNPDQTNDVTDISQMYLSFLIEMSLNAKLIGHGEAYYSRLSERVQRLQPLVETSSAGTEIYHLIQSHGTLSQRIEAFISKIQSQDRDRDRDRYNKLLADARSFYDNDERQRLRTRLEEIADELDGQQRTVVERLCIDIKHRHHNSYDKNDLKYYNRTKKKIIAILSHGSEKLGIIQSYSGESKPNIHSNMNKLSDDGHVNRVENQHGYYNLNKQTKGLFEEKRRQVPVADREEVQKALKRMADLREEHVYPDKARVYDDKEEILQMVQDPPYFTLLNLVLDSSFVLKNENNMDLFFDILDRDLEKIQKTEIYRLSTPSEIVILFIIALLLHNQWEKGLENIRYHLELSERIDDLKKSHRYVHPKERKHIRNLISAVDIEEASTLFSQALDDNDETVDDLKQSIRDIYYYNHKMHTVLDLLKCNQECSTVHNSELREELIEYSVNIPYESLSAELVR